MILLKDSSTAPHTSPAGPPAAGPLAPAEELFAVPRPGDRQGQQAPELTTVLDIMERIFRLA